MLRRAIAQVLLRYGLARATVDARLGAHLARRSPATVWVVLLVGSDRRPARSADSAHAVRGARADAIALAVCDPARRELVILRIPRDVWTELPGIGYQKLGWALDYGGAALQVAAVRELTGCPVHHYVELEFEGFVELVDAIGGVDVVLEEPATDSLADLRLGPGHIRLDGREALALARSRHHEAADGRQTPLGDEIRVSRQNTLIHGALHRLRTAPGLLAALRRFARVARHATVDDRLGPGQLLRCLEEAIRSRVRMVTLPVESARTVDELRSPFPPHQMNSSNHVVFHEPDATLLLKEICSSARGAT